MNTGRKYSLILLPVIVLFCTCKQNTSDNGSENIPDYTIRKVYDLPYDVYESSGIIIFDSLVWTFNDRGSDPVLYGLDLEEGNIQKTIHLQNAENIDWEDIAQDSHTVYIGDFGNNSGSRQDLCIYKISKAEIKEGSDEMYIASEKISFSYEDQIDFTNNTGNTHFDCEALLFDGDSLLLFTKDWVDYNSVLYKLPATTGIYEARRSVKMNSEGLITGADIDLVNHTILLCGYMDYVPYVLVKEDYGEELFLESEMIRINLDDEFGIQFEGIAYFNGKIYLASESAIDVQALYELTIQ